MNSHATVAAKVAAAKRAQPENFCADNKCLWRIRSASGLAPRPCPRHPVKTIDLVASLAKQGAPC